MPLELISTKPAKRKPRSPSDLTPAFGSAYSITEIYAYISIRDQLLSEAEQFRSAAKLASTALANDFVEGCLVPPRPPYETQCLPETDAIRERKRCESVRVRIAELRENAT
jgi:hypothetical protein